MILLRVQLFAGHFLKIRTAHCGGTQSGSSEDGFGFLAAADAAGLAAEFRGGGGVGVNVKEFGDHPLFKAGSIPMGLFSSLVLVLFTLCPFIHLGHFPSGQVSVAQFRPVPVGYR